MTALISNNPDSRYITLENRSVLSDEASSVYHPVNVYSESFDRREKKQNMFKKCPWFCCCCCCKPKYDEFLDAPVHNSTSSLLRPSRSYSLNAETPKRVDTSVPILTVTRHFQDEFSASTINLMLHNERLESSKTLSASEYKVKKIKSSCPESGQDSESISGSSCARSGEVASFIHEVLSCRDSFLKSLEWFENSLTRGKKCKYVKPDDWLELRTEGIKLVLIWMALYVNNFTAFTSFNCYNSLFYFNI